MGDFMQGIGASWWKPNISDQQNKTPCKNLEECLEQCTRLVGYTRSIDDPYDRLEFSAYISEIYPSPTNRPPECAKYQEFQIAKDSEELGFSVKTSGCDPKLLPDSLCKPNSQDLPEDCASRLGWNSPLESEDELSAFQNYVIDLYSTSLGDIPEECYLYIQQITFQETMYDTAAETLQQVEECTQNPSACGSLLEFNTRPSVANTCANKVSWNGNLSSPQDYAELGRYIILSAPWLPTGSIPDACVQMLNIAADKNIPKHYWVWLAIAIAE
jgi:hypothetical protein